MTAIQEQFNRVAEEYDKNRRKFIPCYDDYYIHSTNFITSNIGKPDTVIDLGTGTGLLTYYWYNQYPDVKYVLVDIADEMLKVARQRFAGIENVTYQIMDYTEKLPDALSQKTEPLSARFPERRKTGLRETLRTKTCWRIL